MAGFMTDEDGRPQRAQALGHGIGGDIGAGDLIPLVGQHLGNPAHPGPANPDEVDTANPAHLRDHGTQLCQFNLSHALLSSLITSLHTAATRSVAFKMATRRAACAISFNCSRC